MPEWLNDFIWYGLGTFVGWRIWGRSKQDAALDLQTRIDELRVLIERLRR
jgi:hypothetical protein